MAFLAHLVGFFSQVAIFPLLSSPLADRSSSSSSSSQVPRDEKLSHGGEERRGERLHLLCCVDCGLRYVHYAGERRERERERERERVTTRPILPACIQ